MGSNGASGASGSDAGFFNTEKTKQKKANQSLVGTSDYQGQLDATPRQKKTQVVGNGDGGGAIASTGQVVQAPKVISPTTAEVSQSAATDAEDPLYLRKKRAKAVGRSPTIMTGVTGVTEGLTLGKPSLLGR